MQLATEPLGLVPAFGNAVLFALWVLLADRVAKSAQVGGLDGPAASMLFAAVVATPLGGWQALPAFIAPVALAAGVGVGLCSSVIPYGTDQLALDRLARATYALLTSLLPAIATAVGVVVLAPVPSALEAVEIALVVVGVALHRPSPVAPVPNPTGLEVSGDRVRSGTGSPSGA